MAAASKLFIANRIFCGPLEVLYTLLIFILSKNSGVMPIQLALLACIKPVSSLLAFYLNSFIFDNPRRIRFYILINNTAGSLPCFLFPFIDSVWFYVASYAVFAITMRAVYPAWIEVLKNDQAAPALRTTISVSSSVNYFIGIVLPPILCLMMDMEEGVWRYLFMGFAILRFFSGALVAYIRPAINTKTQQSILNPFKKGWELLKESPQFYRYQMLFFLGGAGIIGSQSVLPIYFKESLDLSYTQLGLAFSLCKGLSFVAASPFWARYAERASLFQVNSLFNCLTVLFFACILAANTTTNWVYLAYIFYGAMQAGCEMSWNLSGPFFAGRSESTLYSSVNLAFVGIRGCLCPLLGYLVFTHAGAAAVFTAAALLCLAAAFYGLWCHHQYRADDRQCELKEAC